LIFGLLHLLIFIHLSVSDTARRLLLNLKSIATEEHVLMLGPWIPDVFAAFSYDIEIFAGVKDFFFVFSQENGNHLLPIGESFIPVLIIKISLDILLTALLVLLDNELVKGVL
jgi:hypothetical protein